MALQIRPPGHGLRERRKKDAEMRGEQKRRPENRWPNREMVIEMAGGRVLGGKTFLAASVLPIRKVGLALSQSCLKLRSCWMSKARPNAQYPTPSPRTHGLTSGSERRNKTTKILS